MKLYNSYSQKIEELKPIEPGKISMYVCGPTVYNYPHIGNARPIVVFDTLKKALSAQGYEVTFASNYTDVDDKIIKTAIEQNVSEKEITDKFIVAYNDVRKGLHADLPDYAPRVTETMDKIIEFIEKMVENGSAYQVGGDVYFRVNSDKKYGELSHQSIDDLMVGARIDENEKKENPLDFTLWKETTEGIKWDSPWSKGRPGWHTECVVMIQDVFKKTLIDIHGGGKDLKFPHHENERAQSMAINESELANYWVHSGMIDINGVKMSKSLGNFITAKDILSKVDPMVLRWFLLATQYRDDVNVSDEIIESSKAELTKIITAYKQACVKLEVNDIKVDGVDEDTYKRFMDAMADDLNTPNAYAVIFEIVKNINQLVRVKEINFEALGKEVNTLVRCMNVLGIVLPDMTMSLDDKKMYQEWMDAKSVKDFKKADELRAQLSQKGIL